MVYDLIVEKGFVVDGTGNPWFKANVYVKGGRVVKVGGVGGVAEKVIDAEGLVVSPGFVDVHNHSDASLLTNPYVESLVMQGVTTVCIGNCGLSAFPVKDSTKDMLHRYLSAFIPVPTIEWHTLGEFLEKIERRGVSCNVAALVGHGSVRVAVMGFDDRSPTRAELEEMKALVAESMEDGAFGISTGLGYAPGFFSTTEEIVELSRVVAERGGIYATHIRSTDVTFVEAVEEAIEIGERAGLPVQISHIESHYPNWGLIPKVLDVLDKARERGVDVTCDVPPYLYGMTTLTSLLPDWVQEGGFAAMVRRLKDKNVRERIKRELPLERDKYLNSSSIILGIDGRWEKIRIVKSEKNPHFNGKSIREISALLGKNPYDVIFDLLIEEGKMIMITGEFHNEDDLRMVLKHPAAMVESDERAYTAGDPASGFPHPRAYGVFPLVYRKYVRGETRPELPEEKGASILSLEEAVRKMTSMPADRLGLFDRGLLRVGMWADLVVFDPERIEDKATYNDPHQYPEGISYVIINGEVVVEKGRHTGALPGRVLRGPFYKRKN